MSEQVLHGIADTVLASNYVGDQIEIALHAGEPLLAGVHWFRAMRRIFEAKCSSGPRITYTVQTNGTLLDNNWATALKDAGAKVGLSIDGPPWLHDKKRRTWMGKPSAQRAIEGAKILRANNMPFTVICVLTRDSLQYPEEMFAFFRDLAPHTVSFNIEENEGIHSGSSMTSLATEELLTSFMQTYWDLCERHQFPHNVREFEVSSQLSLSVLAGNTIRNSLTEPFHCLSIGTNGDFSTFSPELLEATHPVHGTLIIGNVITNSLEDSENSSKFNILLSEIEAGTHVCRSQCTYFNFCRGGSPSNKLAEHGKMDVAETSYCRHSVKVMIDLVVARITHRLRHFNPLSDERSGN